jgi:hypothetical protein
MPIPRCSSSVPLGNRHILVLPSRLLARLELIHVPPADAKAALVLIHAPAEAGHVLGARPGLCLLAGGVDLVRLLELSARGGRLGGRAAAAGEPAADRVADGGADCDSTVMVLVFCLFDGGLEGRVRSGRCHLPEQSRALGTRSGGGSGRGRRRARRCGRGAVLALGCGRGLRGGHGGPGAHGGGSSTLARHFGDWGWLMGVGVVVD